MRKAISIFLLFSLAYGLAGYLAVFYIQQASTRSAVDLALAKKSPGKANEHVILKFALAEKGRSFTFNESDEIIYEGMRYDIASSRIKGDSIYFECYHDLNEERLYAGLGEQVHQNTQDIQRGLSGKAPHANSPLKIFIKDYFCCRFSYSLIRDFSYQQLYSENTGLAFQGYGSVVLNPPEALLS